MGYSTKINPDIVLGDISNIIADDKTDTPFSAGDILFDWQAITFPKKSNKLINIMLHMIGEDGAGQTLAPVHLLFAKSVDQVAPTTLGAVNAAQTACFDLVDHLIGQLTVGADATAQGALALGFGSVYTSNGVDGGSSLPIVIDPEPNHGDAAYDKVYVAAIAGGAFDFSTGVLSNAGVSDDSATTIVTKTVDLRKCFRPGDTVYIHDVDTAIGTVSSLTDNDLTLTANNVGAISTNDEFINANPITATFCFSE